MKFIKIKLIDSKILLKINLSINFRNLQNK